MRLVEELEVDHAAAGIDRDGQQVLWGLVQQLGGAMGHDGEAGGADDGQVRGQGKTPGRGHTDAHAREGSRADGYRDAVEVGEGEARLTHDLRDHGHQPFRMPALAHFEAIAQQPLPLRALPAHRHGHRAEAGIERQDIHATARTRA